MKKIFFPLLLLFFFPSFINAEGIYIIFNPASGGIENQALVELLQNNFYAKLVCTECSGQAAALAKQAVQEKSDIVIAVGDDGTINEIGRELIGSSTALAIIPIGSDNGLAKSLNIPTNVTQAISVIKENYTINIDTVCINNAISYLGVAGIGFDAEIGCRFAKMNQNGNSSYTSALFKTLPGYRSGTYDLIIDGEPIQRKAFMINFANSPRFGNGAFIAPQADMCDGYLDIVIIRPFPFYAAPGLMSSLYNGSLLESSYVKTMKARDVIIAQPNILMEIDGEPLIFDDGAHLVVNPASLKVIVPIDSTAPSIYKESIFTMLWRISRNLFVSKGKDISFNSQKNSK